MIERLELPDGFKRWPELAAVQAVREARDREWLVQQQVQAELLTGLVNGGFPGFCACCDRATSFQVVVGPDQQPNWRETVRCGSCQLISRWRLALHMLMLLRDSIPSGRMYTTEQLSPLFAVLRKRFRGIIGSEFLDASLASGTQVRKSLLRWVRHEDITKSSFGDAELAAVLSFDVLEHVPDYRAAIAEIGRILRPGGLLLLTTPFQLDMDRNVLRAEITEDGTLRHHLPAMYHGDPVNTQGVLCYHDFGWELVEVIRGQGFAHVEVITAWSRELGYLGSPEPVIVARR